MGKNFLSYGDGETIFTAFANKIKSRLTRQDLIDTVGWTGKNIYSGDVSHVFVKSTARTFEGNKFDATLGDKFTLSFDISAVANFDLTNGINVKIIDNANTDVSVSYDFGREEGSHVEHTFTINNVPTGQVRLYFFLWINETSDSATLTASNIMIRRADITDSTYEPYHETVENSKYNRVEANVLGAKNLIPNTNTSQTINGVEFTVNDDGTVTAVGTPTGIIRYEFTKDVDNTMSVIPQYLIGESVIVSGGFTQNNGTIEISCITRDSSKHDIIDHAIPNGETEQMFTIESNAVYVRFYAIFDRNENHTPVNVVLKPMIRLASDPDSTYAPYAKTNRELTLSGAGVPSGGTTGQVLKKASGTDYDTEWGNAEDGGTTKTVSHTLSASANTNFDFTGLSSNTEITEILATDGRGYTSWQYINSGTGIRFILAPDSSTPTVTMKIRYR